jgi:hypothetical protein
MLRIAFLISILTISSCTSVKQVGPVYMHLPKGWEVVPMEGIDSYVGGIFINGKDRIGWDYGEHSNDLVETFPKISDQRWEKFDDSLGLPKEGIIYIPNLTSQKKDSVLRSLRKQTYKYVSIDGYKIKLVLPLKIETGMTGFYVEGIGQDSLLFELDGTDLDRKTHRQFLKAIYTMKFIDRPYSLQPY